MASTPLLSVATGVVDVVVVVLAVIFRQAIVVIIVIIVVVVISCSDNIRFIIIKTS